MRSLRKIRSLEYLYRSGDPPFFFIDPPQSGIENMELDRKWLLCAENSREPFTLIRFYQWAKPTVSFGRNQVKERALNIDYCESKGIPSVRRPTGGRAVFHASELTYAVISNRQGLVPMKRLEDTYRFIAQGLLTGLRKMGVNCDFAAQGRFRNVNPRSRIKSPCFTSTSRFEIVCGGRKIVGSAQRRVKHSFLQHGSIPLQIDYGEMAQVLGTKPELLEGKMISVEETMPRSRVSFSEVVFALESAFRELFAAAGSPED